MIARTLSFNSPGKLSSKDEQLVWDGDDGVRRTFPIEDLGFVILETKLVSITSNCLWRLSDHNVALVVCDDSHAPAAQLLPFAAHTTTQETVASQLVASEAVSGRLWRQVCRQKILNQSVVLKKLGLPNSGRLANMASEVKNHDEGNLEGQAARIYFQTLAGEGAFTRDPEGDWPNPALNYGYGIVRAVIARALVGAGLLCVKGMHHHNKYNAFCLADDMMEPYRPFVDQFVFGGEAPFGESSSELEHRHKAALLSALTCDVQTGDVRRPLQIAATLTAASLARAYLGETKELVLPEFPS